MAEITRDHSGLNAELGPAAPAPGKSETTNRKAIAAADLRQAELDGRYCMGWMAGYAAAQDKAKGKAA